MFGPRGNTLVCMTSRRFIPAHSNYRPKRAVFSSVSGNLAVRSTESPGFMERAMGIEPTFEPWGLLCVPTSLPRGQTNLHPSRPYLTITRERRTHFPLVCVDAASRENAKAWRVSTLPAQQQNRSLFPTHNPTHNLRCLVRLAGTLAVPAVLYVVLKPNHAPLIRARSVVQVHPGPPFKSPLNTRLFSLFPFRGISLKKPICQLFANFTIGRTAPHSGH
jgi:hypothetical protein